MKRDDLPDVVEKALFSIGGTAPVARVAQAIWEQREADLRASGDLFFTWQYEMRWAAQKLRDAGKLTYVQVAGRRAWQLVRGGHAD